MKATAGIGEHKQYAHEYIHDIWKKLFITTVCWPNASKDPDRDPPAAQNAPRDPRGAHKGPTGGPKEPKGGPQRPNYGSTRT